MFETAGVDRVITVDLHASQVQVRLLCFFSDNSCSSFVFSKQQGFFTKPVDNLYAENILIVHLKQLLCETNGHKVMVVSPDAGEF